MKKKNKLNKLIKENEKIMIKVIKQSLLKWCEANNCPMPTILSASVVDFNNEAELIELTCADNIHTAVVHYYDGPNFFVRDWEGPYPRKLSDVDKFEWQDENNNDAIVFNGLPRLF